jgi:hypothetical protein
MEGHDDDIFLSPSPYEFTYIMICKMLMTHLNNCASWLIEQLFGRAHADRVCVCGGGGGAIAAAEAVGHGMCVAGRGTRRLSRRGDAARRRNPRRAPPTAAEAPTLIHPPGNNLYRGRQLACAHSVCVLQAHQIWPYPLYSLPSSTFFLPSSCGPVTATSGQSSSLCYSVGCLTASSHLVASVAITFFIFRKITRALR